MKLYLFVFSLVINNLKETYAGGPSFDGSPSSGKDPQSMTCPEYAVYYSEMQLGYISGSEFSNSFSSLYYDSGLMLKDYMYKVVSDYTNFNAIEKHDIRNLLEAFITDELTKNDAIKCKDAVIYAIDPVFRETYPYMPSDYVY